MLNATNESFQKEVLENGETPVVVDFWAPWCGPCRMQTPVLEAWAATRPDIKVIKVNLDDCLDLARQYNVAAVPTIMVFKNGEAKYQTSGLHDDDKLSAAVSAAA